MQQIQVITIWDINISNKSKYDWREIVKKPSNALRNAAKNLQ